MQAIKYRFVDTNYEECGDSRNAMVRDIQRSMAGIAQEAATQAGSVTLGVWLDPNGRGASLRLVREQEGTTQQGIAWAPSRAFPLNQVETAQKWIAETLQGVG